MGVLIWTAGTVEPVEYGLKYNTISKMIDDSYVYVGGWYIIGPLNSFITFPSPNMKSIIIFACIFALVQSQSTTVALNGASWKPDNLQSTEIGQVFYALNEIVALIGTCCLPNSATTSGSLSSVSVTINYPSSGCSAYTNPTTGSTAVVSESSSAYSSGLTGVYGIGADASSLVGTWALSWYLNQTSSGTNQYQFQMFASDSNTGCTQVFVGAQSLLMSIAALLAMLFVAF